MPPEMTDPQVRHLPVQVLHRADNGGTEAGYSISGIAVPFNEEYQLWRGFSEQFDAACEFEGMDEAKLYWQHREAIGKISGHEIQDAGLHIDADISHTTRGDEAATLVRDGVIDKFSLGFQGIEYRVEKRDDGSELWIWTRVRIREISLVSFPAYASANLTEVRNDHPQQGEPPMPTVTNPNAEVITREAFDTAFGEIREELRGVQTGFAQFRDQGPAPIDTRSAGEVLRALATGDEDTLKRYNEIMERAYEGGTTADAPVKDAWVGDLTRIFDSATGVLGSIFSTGTLPATGLNVEYAELKSNTVKVEKQENEGDDLPMGKVELTTKTAPVETYGGYVQLSRQQIERSTLPVLNRSLEAMAVAAGARKKAVLRAAYLKLVADRKALEGGAGVLKLGGLLVESTATMWTNIVVDAAVRYDKLNLALEGMLVGAETFKFLNGLEIEGKRVFKVSDERDTIGTLNLPGLSGNLAGITVAADPGRVGHAAEFFNSSAIKQYDSATTQLQDENIINLTKSFSVYRYGAVAAEIPDAIVPVEFAA